MRSGRLHAIDAGNLILEIQQNSDTTYRVFDWNRLGLDGKPRAMHVEQSLKSIDFDDFSPSLLHPQPGRTVLADSEEFLLLRQTLKAGEVLEFKAGEQPRILSITEGVLQGGHRPLCRGDNVLLPQAGNFRFTAQGEAVVLITERFA